MSRLETRFAKLKGEGRAAFVAYVMGGDPGPEISLEILRGLPGAGADIIELGLPFSDPMAEGPPIQKAAQRALLAGTKLRDVLGLAAVFRKDDNETPIVLMGYLNPILSMGFELFAAEAGAAGIDGLIVVDCPYEEGDSLTDALDANGISLIRLVTPTTDDARLKLVAHRTSGFVYYVSVAGVTGVKEANAADVAPAVERVRKATGLPVAVGFGVKTPQRAAEVARVADAVVVGSALVDIITESKDPVREVLASAKALGDAVRAARK